MKTITNCCTLALTGLLVAGPVIGGWSAEPIQVGGTIPAFATKDQHEQDFKFEPGWRYLMVSFDMGTGKKANQKLAALGKDYLPQQKALFVANIYGMPGIGRMFALPKMRKYPHRILLADQKDLLAPYPKKADRVTVLRLDGQARVEAIQYWDPEKEDLKTILK